MLYVGIAGKELGKVVDGDDAFEYARMHCGFSVTDEHAPLLDEFREATVSWFFSDNWKAVPS